MARYVLISSVCPNCSHSTKCTIWLGPAVKVGVMEFKGMEHQTRDEQAEALWLTEFIFCSSLLLYKNSLLIHGHILFIWVFGK